MSSPANRKTLDRLREFSNALEDCVDIKSKYTCKKIVLDLQPVEFGPERVKLARTLLRVSQALFAEFLGVSKSAVQDWEQGRKVPSDVACRFMDEIIRDPDYWNKRLNDSMIVTV